MGFKDILVLKEKEHRDSLIFVILLVISYILLQFERYSTLWWSGADLIQFVSNTLLILFIFSIFLRDKMIKYSYIIVPLCLILAYPLLFFLSQTVLGDWIHPILFFISIFYWFFLTAAFSINDVYNSAVKWDKKVGGDKKSSKNIIRWILFFGGTAMSIVAFSLITTIILDFQYHSLMFKSAILSINFFMLLYIILLFVIGIIALFFRKQYLWFGLYFLFVTFYALKLMIDLGKYEYGIGGGGNKTFEIISFLTDIYFLLATFGALMGKKSVAIANKLIKPQTLSIWLIYSLGNTLFSAEEIGIVELFILSNLYPILVGFFGFYAIYSYNKNSKLRNQPKELVMSPESEKPKIETMRKKISKEEKKANKIRKKLEEQLKFIDYLIEKNKLKVAKSNAEKLKKEAEKYELFGLFNEAQKKLDYCNEKLSN